MYSLVRKKKTQLDDRDRNTSGEKKFYAVIFRQVIRECMHTVQYSVRFEVMATEKVKRRYPHTSLHCQSPELHHRQN